jgi:hypothetical protein
MADESVTGGWSGVSRDGKPELIHGQYPGSGKQPNEYTIRTTPVPAGPHGYNWCLYFASQLTGPPFTATHDGDKITVYCWPDDEPNLPQAVDAAIEYANERLRAG